MRKINFDSHIINVFAEMGTEYEALKNLMFDLYNGELEGVSKREAEDKIREMTLKIFGLTKDASARDRKRAYRDYGRQFFDVIEEIVDWTVTTGLKENEWFNQLVNYKNIKEGDENSFVVEQDVILSVARMGKRHHDTILQRLPQGKPYSVDTDVYGAAVGMHIDRYVAGQEDWSKLVNALTKAFVVMVQELILSEVLVAYKDLPVKEGFIGNGAFTVSENKVKFDKILQNVSVANDNANVVIMGTMVGLQQLENLIKVNWIADSQKEDVAAMGRLGNYGRYQLVEIPQRFMKNKVGQDLYDDNVLFIFAAGDDKLVDMIDVGETIIDEITERGEARGRIDDVMKYEIQRELGVATKLGRYFGMWGVTED